MKTRTLIGLAGVTAAIVILVGGIVFLPAGNKPSDPSSLRDEGNCTVIMVGKDASVDGSTITTHTADCGLCDWTWRHVPAANHKPGENRKIYHIDQYKILAAQRGP